MPREEGPNTSCARDSLRIALSCKCASVFPAILLWKLPKSQGCLLGHWGVPPAGVQHHWLKDVATGTEWSYRLPIHCRSALKSAGRHKMPAKPATHSSRGQQNAWQCDSKHVCTKHNPYHIFDSKGDVPRFSDHQSRISMHDDPRNQEGNFDFKCMQCNQANKGAKPLSYFTSRGQTCMQMWCNPKHVIYHAKWTM